MRVRRLWQQGNVPNAALAKIGAGSRAVSSTLWVRKIGISGGNCIELTGVINNDSAATHQPFNGLAMFD